MGKGPSVSSYQPSIPEPSKEEELFMKMLTGFGTNRANAAPGYFSMGDRLGLGLSSGNPTPVQSSMGSGLGGAMGGNPGGGVGSSPSNSGGNWLSIYDELFPENPPPGKNPVPLDEEDPRSLINTDSDRVGPQAHGGIWDSTSDMMNAFGIGGIFGLGSPANRNRELSAQVQANIAAGRSPFSNMSPTAQQSWRDSHGSMTGGRVGSSVGGIAGNAIGNRIGGGNSGNGGGVGSGAGGMAGSAGGGIGGPASDKDKKR